MTLPEDKDEILRLIDLGLTNSSPDVFRPEWARGLRWSGESPSSQAI
jgi:hypothetical protein